jgi:hypothetical protein
MAQKESNPQSTFDSLSPNAQYATARRFRQNLRQSEMTISKPIKGMVALAILYAVLVPLVRKLWRRVHPSVSPRYGR